MKLKTKLLYLAAFLVIGLPLVLTGNGGAGYLWDGAVQDPTTGGWVTPNDMVCIKGVHTNGDLDIVAGTANSRECIYYNTGLTGMNPIDVTGGLTATAPAHGDHTPVVKSALTTYGTCKDPGSGGNSSFVWDFVNNRCLDVAKCSSTDATTKGTLTWNAGSSTCSDSAACTVAGFTKTGYPSNDGAKHALATSICVDGSGNGIPLTDLDRSFAMCAAIGGTWKQTSDSLIVSGTGASATATVQVAATLGYGGSCVAYTRQFRGQDATGTPLAFGPKGTTTAQAGFCYAVMNITSAFTTPATQCPASDSNGHPNAGFNSSTAYDYSFSGGKCTYAKGIKGYLNAALTKADGTTYAAGLFKDMSAYATMGECVANGGSWNNWVGQPLLGTTTVATTPSPANNSIIPNWDFTKQAPETTNGCLHCHSTKTQYNGPFERQKDSYLNHGHKNILRKVTAPNKWAGPDADGVLEFYTSAASGPINFDTAKATIGGIDKPLLYIFGDWMTPAPGGLHTIVDIAGVAKADGTSSELCLSCHTTGWNNQSAGFPGVMGIGTPGFTPAEPAASFPLTSFAGAGNWDRDGVQCPRCHNATGPRVVDTQIAASAFPSTHVTAGGMGSLADGVGRTNLCFGCHQNIAKTDNGRGADADTGHPENLQVTNTATAPNYVPDFEGRGPGNMFLNSPHARFSGNIVRNSLGNFDIENPITCVGTTCTGGNNDGNASKYKSKFQGSNCWQSPTSTSPAATMIVGGEIHEIKTKADCENLYGAGSWRPQLIGGVAATQGTCSTCHNVHNSRFVEEQKEAAFWKVCTDCHNKSLATINHLAGPGTPLGNLAGTAEAWEACATCHMPRATPSGIRMHLWRINTNANYRTFPTATEFGIGAPATKKIANSDPENYNPSNSYENAVWVDVDYVCGQCHGGSFDPSATKNGAQHYSKNMLSMFAKNMHSNPPPTASFNSAPSGATVTLTDTSTDDWMFPDNAVTVNWGDGTSSTGNAGQSFLHTYARPKKYTIVYSVTDAYGTKVSKKKVVTVKFSITAAKK